MTQKIYNVPSYWKDFLKEEFRTCSEYLQWLRCIQDRKECNRFTKKRRDLSTQPTNWDLNFDRRFFRKTRRQARYFLLFSFRRQKPLRHTVEILEFFFNKQRFFLAVFKLTQTSEYLTSKWYFTTLSSSTQFQFEIAPFYTGC